MSILPIVLLTVKIRAELSISLVMLTIWAWVSRFASGNVILINPSIKMKATIDRKEITNAVAFISVFAIFCASSLSFSIYSVKTGTKAAASAPAMNRLNKVSGIKKEAL